MHPHSSLLSKVIIEQIKVMFKIFLMFQHISLLKCTVVYKTTCCHLQNDATIFATYLLCHLKVYFFCSIFASLHLILLKSKKLKSIRRHNQRYKQSYLAQTLVNAERKIPKILAVYCQPKGRIQGGQKKKKIVSCKLRTYISTIHP